MIKSNSFGLSGVMMCAVLLVGSGSNSHSAPWQQADIGATQPAGQASFASNAITVSGSGADIWTNSDAFHYVYQPWTGDGLLVAQVLSIDKTDPWAKAGVMFRQSLAADSPNVFMFSSASQGPGLQTRTSAGAQTSFSAGEYVTPPLWLKLVRSNQTITAYQSLDGKAWTFVGTRMLAFSGTILVGLAVTSHHEGTLCSALFTNVNLASVIVPAPTPTNLVATAVSSNLINLRWTDTGNAEDGFEIERLVSYTNYEHIATVPANVTNYSDSVSPGFETWYYRVRATQGGGDSPYSNVARAITDILPPPWANQDVGNVGSPGCASKPYSDFILDAAGSDIGGIEDSFQFVYQTFRGDGEIVARISSMGYTDPQAKAGVMFRQSLDAGAPNAFMMFTAQPGGGLQTRATAGAQTVLRSGPQMSAPGWVRLVRSGSTFSAYQSSDGNNWTFVGSQTVAMGDAILVGLAASAHNNNTQVPFEAWFGNVRVQAVASSLAFTPPGIRISGRQPNGAMILTITGQTGKTYGIEASTNLTQWTLLTNIVNTSGGATMTDSASAFLPMRYYRAVQR